MQILVSIGIVVMELCCHKINMNTKEKHIIKRILKKGQKQCCAVSLVPPWKEEPSFFLTKKGSHFRPFCEGAILALFFLSVCM